jgi:hypothetical protein
MVTAQAGVFAFAVIAVIGMCVWMMRRNAAPAPAAVPSSGPARSRFVVRVQPKAWQRYLTIGSTMLGLLVFPVLSSNGFLPKHGLAYAVIVVGYAIGVSLAVQWVFLGRKIVIQVTAAGLTVDKRPGEVFAFRDAELGQWRKGGSLGVPGAPIGPYVGRALFLTAAAHRFVVGDLKNPGNANDIPLKGPQVLHADLDAWTTDSSAFNELLATVGSARGAPF